MGSAGARRDGLGRRRAPRERATRALTLFAALALAAPLRAIQALDADLEAAGALLDALDEHELESGLGAVERLREADRAGAPRLSSWQWRCYVAGATRLCAEPLWSAALREAPEELLERLAQDPRSTSQWDVALLIESALCVRLRERGELRAALTRSLGALERSTMSEDHRCQFWTEVARDHTALGDYAAALGALECAQRSLDALHSAGGDVLRESELASARTRVEIELGRPDRAAASLARVRELAAAVGDEPSHAQWMRDEADFALASDNAAQLITRLERELAALAQPPALLERLAFAYLYSRTDDVPGRERARELLEQVVEHSDSEPLLRASAQLGLAIVARRAGGFDLASRRLEQARAGADATLALEIAAEHGALALARGERGERLAPVCAELRGSLEHTLARWASIPPQPDGIGFTNYGERRALLIELMRVEHARDSEHGPRNALRQWLRAEALGSLARELGAAPCEPDELQARVLGPRRGALLYAPGPQRGCLFAIDSERIELLELEANHRWREEQRALVRLLSTPPEGGSADERRLSEQRRLVAHLGAFLLPAGARAALERWDELTVIGVDMLGYVPFECLELDGRELGLAKDIAYSPSLLLLGALATRWEAQGPALRSGLRLVGAPSDPIDARTRSQGRAIEWSAAREARLRRMWGPATRSSIGADATWAALRKDSGRELALLEILAHGYYDASQSPPVGIALARAADHAGYIGAAQLAQLEAPPIVALAVCGAARGPLRSGDEATAHLGGATLRAGASVVLLAALDIEQAATEALLERAYDALTRSGVSTARALRLAREELARSADTRDPYYRNLLHCVGLGHTPLVARRSSEQARAAEALRARWPAVLALGVLGAAAAAALVRRRAL